jgi:hypothetical protein
MPSPLRPDQRRFPLHVHISVMFTFLLLLTGVVLGLFNYRQTTRIILSSSENLFNRIEQDVRLDLHSTYEPIRHLLSLLANDQAADASNLQQRLALLKPFTQSLKDNSDLASLYLGTATATSSWFALRTNALKTLLNAADRGLSGLEHRARRQRHRIVAVTVLRSDTGAGWARRQFRRPLRPAYPQLVHQRPATG